MKKTKTLLALIIGTMTMVACSEDTIEESKKPQLPEQTEQTEQTEPAKPELVPMTFTAHQENDDDTRTIIDGTKIKWSEGDKISIFDGTDANAGNQCFTLTSGANSTSGEFRGVADANAGTYTALYPYTAGYLISATLEDCLNAGIDKYDLEDICNDWADTSYPDEVKERIIEGDMSSFHLTPDQQTLVWSYLKGGLKTGTMLCDGKISPVYLPAVQTITADSHVDASAMLMMAQSTEETTDLKFKNVVSYFKFTAPFNCTSVQITDNAKSGKMAGTLTLDYNNGNPTATVTDKGVSSITLTGPIAQGQTYYIATLPQTFAQGITMNLIKDDGTEYVKSSTNSYTLNRNKVSNMGTPDGTIIDAPYVTFSAAGTQTLGISYAVEDLEYSVGGSAWAKVTTSPVTFGNGKDIRLRGTNGYGTANATVYFDNDTEVACSGDIRTLVDYKNYETVSTENACFFHLFDGCSQLTSAPALPATVLAEGCYEFMFNKCTSLKTAPALPATKLAEGCYKSMFHGCTSLEAAPSLPADQLAQSCYLSMFQGCTSLITAPALPATELAEGCYESMFEECYSLTEAPALPATELAGNCYSSMFQGCTSLTTAPAALPATQLVPACYQHMFQGCTSLTAAPALPATQLESYCYLSMFRGCTSLTTAPELPATTLAEECYESMFQDCIRLRSAPSLPAGQMALGCYESMFKDCTSLINAPALLPAAQLAQDCYEAMFSGCTALTTAPALPATQLAEGCYQYMFNECSALTAAPVLPAETLVEDCYRGMFKDCSSLNSVKADFTTTPGRYYTYNWLDGVADTGTFEKSGTATWNVIDSNGVPYGWTIIQLVVIDPVGGDSTPQ